jgi:hypothetical protein
MTITKRLTLFRCSVPPASLDALDILKRRFRRAEIDREGFDERSECLIRAIHAGAARRSG